MVFSLMCNFSFAKNSNTNSEDYIFQLDCYDHAFIAWEALEAEGYDPVTAGEIAMSYLVICEASR